MGREGGVGSWECVHGRGGVSSWECVHGRGVTEEKSISFLARAGSLAYGDQKFLLNLCEVF
jgi:hypothetical protein